MRRLFWLGIGAGIGVLVVRRVTKTAEAYTPKGLANAVSGLGDSFRDFADDVRDAMVDREGELLGALGVGTDGRPEQSPDERPAGPSGRHGR